MNLFRIQIVLLLHYVDSIFSCILPIFCFFSIQKKLLLTHSHSIFSCIFMKWTVKNSPDFYLMPRYICSWHTISTTKYLIQSKITPKKLQKNTICRKPFYILFSSFLYMYRVQKRLLLLSKKGYFSVQKKLLLPPSFLFQKSLFLHPKKAFSSPKISVIFVQKKLLKNRPNPDIYGVWAVLNKNK